MTTTSVTRLVLVAALSVTLACASLLRLTKDGGSPAYDGVVVAIGDSVEEGKNGEGQRLVDGIQEIFRRASPVLHKATKEKASFGEVTVVVPRSWKTVPAALSRQATYETYADAHVRVDGPNPAHGDAPYTQQSKGCGEQGDFIHYTPSYLLDLGKADGKYGDAGKVLVHEWAHFRYGVFDEYGYPGDPVYPHVYFDDDNRLQHTGCANGGVHGKFSDECRADADGHTGQPRTECRFTPDLGLGANTHITSSLMYMHYLPEVFNFCTVHDHNKFAPTKHNALCDGRSTWDVVSKHPDFSDDAAAPSTTAKEPTFKIVQAGTPKFYILFDYSLGMKDNDRFDFTRKALMNFVTFFLPENSEIGFLKFSNRVHDMLMELAKNNRDTRDQLDKTFPTATSPHQANWQSVLEALRKGKEQFRDAKGGILVLFTAGFKDPPTQAGANEFNQICEELQQAGIKVVSILYPFDTKSTIPVSQYLNSLADKTNGKNFYIYERHLGYNTNSLVLGQLNSAVAAIGQMDSGEPQADYEIFDQKFQYGSLVNGNFTVSQSMGKKLTVLYIAKQLPQIDSDEVAVTSPNGTTYRVNSKNAIKVESSYGFVFPDAEAGEWTYRAKATMTSIDQPSLAVIITSVPKRNSESIRLRAWTNVGNAEVNASATPVIIYAEVMRGNIPVANARVWAVVQRPSRFGQNFTTVEVDLLDSGNGVPDITRGDGIYSRFFTNFVDGAEGHYLVNVFATDNDNGAVVAQQQQHSFSGVLPIQADAPYCCGSNTGPTGTVPTGRFRRYFNAGTFNVVVYPDVTVDVTPPSKVLDLQIKDFLLTEQSVILTWTAPGDNYDAGRANRYDVRFSKKRSELMSRFDEQPPVTNPLVAPADAGTEQELRVTHPYEAERMVVYYALRTADGRNNWSPISNVIGVQFPELPTTFSPMSPGPTVTPTTPVKPKNDRTLSGAEIGIIVGCVLGVLIIIFILVVCIIIHRRRSKARQATATSSTSTGQYPHLYKTPGSDSTSDNTKTPPPPQPKQSPQRQQHEKGGNGHVFTVEGPQFMSASELLERHEMQKRSQKDGMMDDDDLPKPVLIPEDYYITQYNDDVRAAVPYNDNMAYNDDPRTIHYNDIRSAPYNNMYRQQHNNSFERNSLSDKPSSSVTSLSTTTNDHRRDNGYFTSYEETSEDSGILKHPRGMLPPPGPMTASKSSLARRVVSESQV